MTKQELVWFFTVAFVSSIVLLLIGAKLLCWTYILYFKKKKETETEVKLVPRPNLFFLVFFPTLLLLF